MTGHCKACGETICVCTQDNKDAALELAKEFTVRRTFDTVGYYNAARKPLEEERDEAIKRAQTYFNEMCDVVEKHDKQYQQLLATQEAYQRVVEALKDSNGILDGIYGNARRQAEAQITDNNEALANPPSLEAVERKKLEDEIVVLEDAKFSLDIGDMIAERKAKLEKMK